MITKLEIASSSTLTRTRTLVPPTVVVETVVQGKGARMLATISIRLASAPTPKDVRAISGDATEAIHTKAPPRNAKINGTTVILRTQVLLVAVDVEASTRGGANRLSEIFISIETGPEIFVGFAVV